MEVRRNDALEKKIGVLDIFDLKLLAMRITPKE